MEAPRKWTLAHEAAFLRARRPWLALYDPATRKVPLPRSRAAEVGLDGAALPALLAPVQLLLGPDALLEVFSRLSPRWLLRCAAVCRQWRAVAEAQPLWRAACLAVPEWRRAAEGDASSSSSSAALIAPHLSGAALVEHYVDRFFAADWRAMYRLRPRLRVDGLYISRNTYLRRGCVEFQTRVPVHLVCYFRYYAFSPNGTFLYRTTPSPPSTQRVLSRPRAALRQDGVLSGVLSVRGALVHTVMTSCHGRVSRLHTWLRLRSTVPGANNRLDVRSMLSVDDGAPEPEEPAAEHDAYSDEAGRGWHAAHGGVGAWHEGGSVRAYTRGLTPYVFVPWEELDTTELNLSTEEMDFYVPG